MLELIRQGVEINPHYRKITPMVADELARWGDWKNATWIWESVLRSRPYIVAILTNVARGQLAMGNIDSALAYLERAKKLQARAPAVRSLEVMLLSRTGQAVRALELGREAINDNVVDFDLANATFGLAWRAGDYALASKAMESRMTAWPASRAEGLVQLGNMYASGAKDPERALGAFRQAIALASEPERSALMAQIPPEYRARLAEPATPQTSASKG